MAEARAERRGLGRGLSALMADVGTTSADADAPAADRPRPADRMVAIERLHPNPDQPRRHFDGPSLAELAESIAARGIIQPLIVRAHPAKDGEFEIVAGERRWRAAQKAKLHEVPVVLRAFTDTEVLEVAIIENIQRSDLNPVEEAQGYRQLIDRFGHTQEQMAEALGKSRSHIANAMRLLTLPEDVISHLQDGSLTAGHARALITSADPSGLARQVISKGLSVRETERLAKAGAVKPNLDRAPIAEKDADTRALEADLSAALGLKVSVDDKGGSGVVAIRYRSLEELDDLCAKLSAVR
ncbi:MAG: ParB/RepB/Spo0J family partition protein [Paracoccaceae bacterium]|nr:ParB/RepB/Spo0J family partition protein [Paracoccaceae bacterium]